MSSPYNVSVLIKSSDSPDPHRIVSPIRRRRSSSRSSGGGPVRNRRVSQVGHRATTAQPAIRRQTHKQVVQKKKKKKKQTLAPDEYVVEDIIDHKTANGRVLYKVKWEGYGSEDCTWEPQHHFSPNLPLLQTYQVEHGLGYTSPASPTRESIANLPRVKKRKKPTGTANSGTSTLSLSVPASPSPKRSRVEKPKANTPCAITTAPVPDPPSPLRRMITALLSPPRARGKQGKATRGASQTTIPTQASAPPSPLRQAIAQARRGLSFAAQGGTRALSSLFQVVRPPTSFLGSGAGQDMLDNVTDGDRAGKRGGRQRVVQSKSPNTVRRGAAEVIRQGIPVAVPVKVVDYGNPKGKGVISTHSLPRNTFVCPYAGELLSKAQAEERELKYGDQHHCYIFFFRWKSKLWGIDSTIERENNKICRLINHSRKNPNCKAKMIEVDGRPHVGIFTLRTVHAGEELSYDYGDLSKASIQANPWLNNS